MQRLTLGVCLNSLGLSLRPGLQAIERMGVTGVQVDAAGDLSPKSLSQTGRREFLHLLRAHNLELAALACPLRHGLDVFEGQEERIEHIKRVMSLSFDLGARLVTIQAGAVPDKPDAPQARLMTEALLALGQHGDRTGTVLALETGLEPGQALREFLDRFDTGGLGVDLDPANLLLGGFDLYASTRALASKIVFSQATDARRSGTSRAAQEVPIGHGDIDWMEYLSVLEEIGYRGWLVAKRDIGHNRLGDVAAGVQFLRRFIVNT